MIPCPDSIYPGNIPMTDARQAVLGYADGKWPTAARLPALFPGAQVVSLTVTGATLDCDGIDCEPGNPDAAHAADWARRKIAADPASRPVVYASVIGDPGYGMPDVLDELGKLGIRRVQVRLHTAHYTGSAHVCGPRTCGELTVDADGTQWTSSYDGLGGTKIDMSALRDDYFGAAPPAPVSWEDELVANIPVLRQGDSGMMTGKWQALLLASGYSLAPAGEDKQFGPVTDERTRKFQEDKRITVDGVVGPQTWGAMLSA